MSDFLVRMGTLNLCVAVLAIIIYSFIPCVVSNPTIEMARDGPVNVKASGCHFNWPAKQFICNSRLKLTKIGSGKFSNLSQKGHPINSITLRGGIHFISETAFEGIAIEYLDIGFNQLTCIPNLYAIHQSIKWLGINRNLLGMCTDEIHYNITFNNLESIYLSENKLKTLPFC